MRIFGLGLPELIVILIVILLIFGPKNLPKLGNALGRAVKNLKEGLGSKKKGEQAQPSEDEVVIEQASDVSPASAPKKVGQNAQTVGQNNDAAAGAPTTKKVGQTAQSAQSAVQANEAPAAAAQPHKTVRRVVRRKSDS